MHSHGALPRITLVKRASLLSTHLWAADRAENVFQAVAQRAFPDHPLMLAVDDAQLGRLFRLAQLRIEQGRIGFDGELIVVTRVDVHRHFDAFGYAFR